MARGKRAIVVGAGVAGLTAAARLAHCGYETTVLEKQADVGGRAAQATWEGFTFDLGPTLLFMLDAYRTAFASWGGDFDREVPTIRLRPNYRLTFADGAALTVSPVLCETIASLEALQPGASGGFLRYLAGAARAYDLSMREFVGTRIRHPGEFFTARKIAALVRAGAFRRLFPAAARAFGSPALAAAFCFQSMYLGMSPFTSPELYRLLLFTEMGEGVFFPQGGIGALPRALARAAVSNGATIRCDSEVTALDVGSDAVRWVEVGGQRIGCDIAVLDADLPYAYGCLLNEPMHRSRRMRLTPSALTIYAALDRRYDDLLHHEFLMPADLRATCDDIFSRGRMPRDPAIYLAAPARTDPSFAPPGAEALYVLVPVPNLTGSTDWRTQSEAIVESIFERIERRRLPGLRSHVRFAKVMTPLDFAQRMNLSDGAAFGLSHDILQVGPLRPDNRHSRYRNVFFVGASTRPATGLPLVTMGAMQTVDRILEELPPGNSNGGRAGRASAKNGSPDTARMTPA